MKTKLYKYLFVLFLIGFTMSCKEEFLEVTPIAIVNEDAFYASLADAEQATTAVYAQLAYMTTFDREISMIFGSMASDDAEAGGEDPGDVISMQDIATLKHLPSTVNLTNPYGVLYKAINLANKAITKLPAIVDLDNKAKPEIINNRVAEVKFIRAISYFYLVQMFGEVVLVDHVLTSDETQKKRATLLELFDFMEKDLTEAIAVLPVRYNASEIGRVTKGAAMGLLAKVYLFESSYAALFNGHDEHKGYVNDPRFANLRERWSEAQAMAEKVINLNDYNVTSKKELGTPRYELVGKDGVLRSCWRGDVDGFRFLFTSNGDNCEESVFEVQNVQDGLGWLSTRGNSIVWWSCARYIYTPAGKKENPKFWGFNTPTQDLANAFEVGDPRFGTTLHTVNGNDSLSTANGWSKICFDNTPTGMYQAKYECSYDEFVKVNPTWDAAPMNLKLLRFGEVVLIAAEAAYMAGNTAKAIEYVNMIRTRARMCGAPGNTIPADLTSVTLAQIKNERRVELAMEGQRFFDLVRWGDAETKLDGFTKAPDYQIVFVHGKHEFFPIPQKEVDLSKGNIEQYTGW